MTAASQIANEKRARIIVVPLISFALVAIKNLPRPRPPPRFSKRFFENVFRGRRVRTARGYSHTRWNPKPALTLAPLLEGRASLSRRAAKPLNACSFARLSEDTPPTDRRSIRARARQAVVRVLREAGDSGHAGLHFRARRLVHGVAADFPDSRNAEDLADQAGSCPAARTADFAGTAADVPARDRGAWRTDAVADRDRIETARESRAAPVGIDLLDQIQSEAAAGRDERIAASDQGIRNVRFGAAQEAVRGVGFLDAADSTPARDPIVLAAEIAHVR